MSDDENLYEEFGDFLHEVPEAEKAIRDYRALRKRQSLKAAKACVDERNRQRLEDAWNALRAQLRASGMRGLDSFH